MEVFEVENFIGLKMKIGIFVGDFFDAVVGFVSVRKWLVFEHDANVSADLGGLGELDFGFAVADGIDCTSKAVCGLFCLGFSSMSNTWSDNKLEVWLGSGESEWVGGLGVGYGGFSFLKSGQREVVHIDAEHNDSHQS